jgi:hypothetical protein
VLAIKLRARTAILDVPPSYTRLCNSPRSSSRRQALKALTLGSGRAPRRCPHLVVIVPEPQRHRCSQAWWSADLRIAHNCSPHRRFPPTTCLSSSVGVPTARHVILLLWFPAAPARHAVFATDFAVTYSGAGVDARPWCLVDKGICGLQYGRRAQVPGMVGS